ncbi:hypothetical protein EDB82DRAFT_100203 [Fusarium venenatum]|nr:hypothetical protein EDB82DRAFT_100203 [Fusarium venenatum]
MSTNKNKVQSDTKEDERRKLIENLDTKIKNLHNISDDVEYGLLKLQSELYNISQKRTKNLKARIKKMIEEGNVESLANGHDCHLTNSQSNLNQGHGHGQGQGASTWPAVPEDFYDDE